MVFGMSNNMANHDLHSERLLNGTKEMAFFVYFLCHRTWNWLYYGSKWCNNQVFLIRAVLLDGVLFKCLPNRIIVPADSFIDNNYSYDFTMAPHLHLSKFRYQERDLL